jgi:hypothetical protein
MNLAQLKKQPFIESLTEMDRKQLMKAYGVGLVRWSSETAPLSGWQKGLPEESPFEAALARIEHAGCRFREQFRQAHLQMND